MQMKLSMILFICSLLLLSITVESSSNEDINKLDSESPIKEKECLIKRNEIQTWLHPSLRQYCFCNDDEKNNVGLSPALKYLIDSPPSSTKLQTTISRFVRQDLRDLSSHALMIWGFAPPAATHTHRFIHESLFVSAVQALVRDIEDDENECGFCACWLDDNLAIKIDPAHVSSLVERSVVFTSPIYNSVRYLPFSEQAKYIVHGRSEEANATDRIAVAKGRAVTLIVYRYPLGGDFAPVPPHIAYAGSPPAEWPQEPPIYQDASCASRTLNLLWGCDALPGRIETNKQALTHGTLAARAGDPSPYVVFVGSIWHRNVREWVDFAEGCSRARLPVHVFGSLMGGIPAKLHRLILHHGPNTRVSTRDADALTRTAFLAPAPQGAKHVESVNRSYVTDRVFRLVAVGQPVVTNNPGVAALFRSVRGGAVLYRPDVSSLCGDAAHFVRHLTDPAGIHALMDNVAAYHTYLSRWHTYLRFLRAVIADGGGGGGGGGGAVRAGGRAGVSGGDNEFGCG